MYIYIYSKPRCNTAIIDASSPCLRNCWGHNPESQRTFWRQGVETTKVRHKTKRVVERWKAPKYLQVKPSNKGNDTLALDSQIRNFIGHISGDLDLLILGYQISPSFTGWYPHHLIPSISAQIPSCWKRSRCPSLLFSSGQLHRISTSFDKILGAQIPSLILKIS